MNTVASMLDYRAGDNIVLADVEFTSNVYPWMRAAKHENAELRVVKSRNDGIWPADFEKLVDDHTRVVAISHVQMANGFKCGSERNCKNCSCSRRVPSSRCHPVGGCDAGGFQRSRV